MKPVTPEPREGVRSIVIAKDQPEYLPLPANVHDGMVETKWRFEFADRIRILLFGSMYLTIWSFGQPLQPLRPTVKRDTFIGGGEPECRFSVRDHAKAWVERTRRRFGKAVPG